MDLDKIQKLARLALNNPNENEPNLAARKVCELVLNGSVNTQSQTRQPAYPFTDYGFGPVTWDYINDILNQQGFRYSTTSNKTTDERPPLVDRACSECDTTEKTRYRGMYYKCSKCRNKAPFNSPRF